MSTAIEFESPAPTIRRRRAGKPSSPTPRTRRPVFEQTQISDTADLLHYAIQNPLHVQREINNRSLYEFIKFFFPVVSPHEFSGNWHIEFLCRELEEVAERVSRHEPKKHDLVINVPPGTTKTITCSIMFPVWCWTKWPWMRFICSSYSAALSLESATYSRDLIMSQPFMDIYPELLIKEDKNTKGNFAIAQHDTGRNKQDIVGGSRYSTSVGGTLTGFHGDILIVDDPLNPIEAASEAGINNANFWVEQTLSTRKTNKAVTPTILIMQRLHQNDPSGHILGKKKKNVRHICMPGEIRHYRDKVNPPELVSRYKDDLLDTKRLSWKVLRDMEADLGQYGYAGQVGQDPTPPGGGMFKVDHFNIIDQFPNQNRIVCTVRYWDKAATHEDGAFTVGVKMSRLTDNFFLVHDVKRGQWGSHERERIIRETAVADGYDVDVWVEQEPGSGGKESAEGTIRNLAGYKVFAERPTGDKAFRADPYSVQVNNGSVMLLRGDWNSKYVEEHRFFPFGTYKDQVDASSGAFQKLLGKKEVQVY